MLLSSREKILLHLYLESRKRQVPARVLPASFSQEGISEATGVARKHVPRNLKGLMSKEFIREEKAHITGAPQRRKVYFPTSDGREEALGIRDKALSADITIRIGESDRVVTLGDGIRKITLRNPEIDGDDLILFIRNVEEEGAREILDEERVT